MSVRAHNHAQRRHPAEFAICFPHVAAIINAPLYAGDDFRNPGKIELVGRPPVSAEFILVAVEIIRDMDGRYNVTSVYPLSATKVEQRRQKGYLRRVLIL